MKIIDIFVRALEQIPLDDARDLIIRHFLIVLAFVHEGGSGAEFRIAEPRKPFFEIVFIGIFGARQRIQFLDERIIFAAAVSGQIARVVDRQKQHEVERQHEPHAQRRDGQRLTAAVSREPFFFRFLRDEFCSFFITLHCTHLPSSKFL